MRASSVAGRQSTSAPRSLRSASRAAISSFSASTPSNRRPKALLLEGCKLNLCNVEPTAVCRGIVKINGPSQLPRCLRLVALVEGSGNVRVQVVAYQPNFLCFRKVSLEYRSDLLRKIDFPAPRPHPHVSPALKWREEHKQVLRAVTLVFVVDSFGLAGLHRHLLSGRPRDLHRLLIEADQRTLRIGLLPIKVQNVLHAGHKIGVLPRGQLPVFFQMRLEFVFLSARRTVP